MSIHYQPDAATGAFIQPSARVDHQTLVTDALCWIGDVLCLIAGLAGAIAVHLIFVGHFLPQLMSQTNTPAENAPALIGVSDAVGFVVFLILAEATGSRFRREARGRR
ncbi:MAG TPA: hypothetical protein VEK76_01150 [Candidatus Binatia bacterium]|nr:hypothetical protein [Candidatus Binatia bacterium]